MALGLLGSTRNSDIDHLVVLFSSARVFNIYPKKGAILPGSDADIIILNHNSTFKISADSHHSRSDTNVYEGRKGKVMQYSIQFHFKDKN